MPDNPMGNFQQKLQWCCHGENCGMCDSLDGRVYTYDMWMSAGVWPGFHLNCDCTLKMVGSTYVLSDPDFFGTDLNLLSDTINPLFFTFRLHWDPNYKPFSWYMTEEIMNAHLEMGKELSIGEVLRRMKDQFVGFFKRSDLFDNFFVWRTFRTLQHYQNINDTATGAIPWYEKTLGQRLGLRYVPYQPISQRTGSTFRRYDQTPYINARLKPETLKPRYPYQSNYTESR